MNGGNENTEKLLKQLNTDYYNAGMSTLSDILEAQSLLQQSCYQYAESCAEYQIKLLKYKQVTGQ